MFGEETVPPDSRVLFSVLTSSLACLALMYSSRRASVVVSACTVALIKSKIDVTNKIIFLYFILNSFS